jgi:CheY-like chemotaxis protein/anti-sigma regulatory factor (Ser/Thr protein kinase)
LTNLLSNGVKFTERGKITLTVTTGDRGRKMNIYVKDTGIGIDKNDLENIFQPFRQSENQDRLQKKGTGLGLSISRQIWQMLGGEISVESKKGRGTTFHLQLPLKEVGEEEIKTTPKISIADKSDQAKRIQKNSSRRLVDDNQDNQYAVKFILEDKGYNVSFASNGAEGIKKALREKPSLILMDMMMPGIDGYQATKKIRLNKDLNKTPIVAMTAKTKAEDKGKALAAGCSDYLSKPFTMDDIINKVHQWIGTA